MIDGDPHGFQIYLTYKYGSKSMAFSSSNLAIPSIILLGIYPSSWFSQLKIAFKDLILLSRHDVKKCHCLLRNPHVCRDQLLKREVSLFIFYNYKIEIQAISTENLAAFLENHLSPPKR